MQGVDPGCAACSSVRITIPGPPGGLSQRRPGCTITLQSRAKAIRCALAGVCPARPSDKGSTAALRTAVLWGIQSRPGGGEPYGGKAPPAQRRPTAAESDWLLVAKRLLE